MDLTTGTQVEVTYRNAMYDKRHVYALSLIHI